MAATKDGYVFNFGDQERAVNVTQIDEKNKTQYKKWATFYRLNLHLFVEHYLGITNLKWFQKIMLFLMGLSTLFVTVASRGISKSYTIGLYAICRAILYPNSRIIIASGTRGQASLIIKEKIIGEFYRESATLRCEIKRYVITQNAVEVEFRNGSRIFAVTAADSSRGYRGNVLIEDEFRLIKKEINDQVLIPMLSVPRQPKYLSFPEFEKYDQEDNIQIHISSAYYASEWIYDFTKEAVKSFIAGKQGVYTLAMDYKLALDQRLTTQKYIDSQKRGMDTVSFAMEFDNIFYGQNKNALFTYDSLRKSRVLIDGFKPIKHENYAKEKQKHRDAILKAKQPGEIRIIGVDVALLGGRDNDATQFVCMRLIPKGAVYRRKVDYIESMEGVHSALQAKRLKQLYEDYVADIVVMDCAGASLSLYEQTSLLTVDDERGVTYSPWVAINSAALATRVFADNPISVVYSIIASEGSNHEMASSLRQVITDGNLELLIEENDAFEQFIKNSLIKEFAETDMETADYAHLKMELLHPYMQTTALINELINLDYKMVEGKIHVITKGTRRKDRYSALLYANYYAKTLEVDLRSDSSEYDTADYSVSDLDL